ncbi:MAG: PQQ-binding-like beta-propeller repeat protein [Planctomycetes bacterium]|nr:PQQ-binding-like beta-propeller repeat protein [Planctomycetota bacterium]MBL7038436.1 PQQ-binding-like beta-propeller repeat protein [Pirellulaceae bacterium]
MKVTFVNAILVAVLACSSVRAEQSAEDILEASGVSAGLVVHLGCGEGKLTTKLRANDALIVQGLDAKPENIQKARAHIQSLDLGGKVSAAVFNGERLPYVDNLVNLVVASDECQVTRDEITRVLVPGGVALFINRKSEIENRKWVKPWPDDIDDWTHYLYDSRGTSVSNDRLAGHPKGMQWTGGPFWARSHEHTASMQAMVSANGRVFYVMDEGPTESIQLPSKLVLTARDAFNGTVLWKRPLPYWFNALYPLKSGPGWMPRRLVAVDDRVYIAPGIGQDLLCLDATSGDVVCTYDDTATTFELVVSDGVVFAAVDTNQEPCDYNQQHPNCWKERDRASIKWQWDRDQGTRVVKAIQADSGEVLWQRETPVTPMTLAADGGMVCFYDGSAVVALDRRSGEELWKADVLDLKQVRTGYSGPRLIICGDQVLLSPMGHIVAICAQKGEVLWSVKDKPRSGHFSLEDFYAIGDRVWALQRGNNGAFTTYSLKTGETLDVYSNPIPSFYIHQRCYPGRATAKYLLPPIMGTTVYDMEEDAWFNNHWVRGGCIYGAMPANGMLYVTPHACACYYQSKLNGFNAVAPESQPAEAPPADKRLVKGPAYGKIRNSKSEIRNEEWPAFRHDNTRSGYAKTDVVAEVEQAWKKDFGTKLTQPVVAGGKLVLSAVDTHTVYALDATSGREVWQFIAGGRVNSPPTLHGGLAIFGCADGCVYALRASDGEVAWKFKAAPSDRKLMAYGQLESVWPLPGSVLIQDGKLYCVAGRSMFLDGGLRMLILKPETGELISENVMDSQVPGTEKRLDDLLMGKHMPVALPDILSGDGEYVYMKSQTFTPDGKRVRFRPQRPDTQYDQELHLFSPISFLDEGWHQRTYWIYGRAAGEGWAEFQLPPKRVPCGRILCIDEQNAYGYARDPELMCNTSVSEYRLYSAGKTPARKVGIPKLEGTWIKGQYPADNPLAAHTVDWKQLAQQPKEKLSAVDYNWIQEEPDVVAKAMVLANDRLFVAGPRDVVDEKEMWGRSNEEAFQERMTEQAAWLDGRHGGVMQVFSKNDGKKLAEHKLDCLPAFDGLIAASGSLYMVTQDGSIVCYQGK